jgi:hypothetical protein
MLLGRQIVGEGGQPEGRNSKLGKSKKHGGGKPPLEQTHPLQFQVYQRIEREHQPGNDHKDTVDRLKSDRDFTEQVKAAELKLSTRLVRKALALFAQREVRKKPT